MADVRMKLSLRTKDGKVKDFTDAFPSDMTIGQVLMEAQRLYHVAHHDVKLTCIKSEVRPFKPKLMVLPEGRMDDSVRTDGDETKQSVTRTEGFETTDADETGGSSSTELSASASAGYSGIYVAASVEASVGSTSSSNWSSSRSQSAIKSKTTTVEYSFPVGVLTEQCSWYVDVPRKDDKKKTVKFFLPGPMITFTDGTNHEGLTMREVEESQPTVNFALVESYLGKDSEPEPGTWYKIMNKDGNCLTFPDVTGSRSDVQLEVQEEVSGDNYYSQQWSFVEDEDDKLECRHNDKRVAGTRDDKLFVTVWHNKSLNGAAVGMRKTMGNGQGETWRSQKWRKDPDGSLVNGCGLILTTKKDGPVGSKVHLWDDVGQGGQEWTFVPVFEEDRK